MLHRELELQKMAIKFLESHHIYPFSCIFTYSVPPNDGLLSLTFWLPSDLLEILDILDYKVQCDKSGFLIIENSSTLILEGLALFNFYELARSI